MFLRKPTAVLSDMPWNVKKLIVESAEKSVLKSLRAVSHEFEAYIPAPTVHCTMLRLTFRATGTERKIEISISRRFKAMTVVFSPDLNGATLRITRRGGEPEKKAFIEGSNYIYEAIACFQSLVRMPGLKVKILIFWVDCEDCGTVGEHLTDKSLFLGQIQTSLKNLPQKPKIEQFSCSSVNSVDALNILPYLDEKVLKKFINHPSSNPATDEAMSMLNWLDIPRTYILEVPVDRLPIVFQYARKLPTFESFSTSWSAEHVEIHFESFMEETVWSRDRDGSEITRIATEDPNFVLLVSVYREPFNHSLSLRKERVQPTL